MEILQCFGVTLISDQQGQCCSLLRMEGTKKVAVHWSPLLSSPLRAHKEYKSYFACGIMQRRGHHISLQTSGTLWDLSNMFFNHFMGCYICSSTILLTIFIQVKQTSMKLVNSLILDHFEVHQKISLRSKNFLPTLVLNGKYFHCSLFTDCVQWRNYHSICHLSVLLQTRRKSKDVNPQANAQPR